MFDDTFALGLSIAGGHRYSLAATGIKFHSREFSTRPEAVIAMRKYCSDHNLTIVDVWDDHHNKTYICGPDRKVRFYINREL